jgi:hypothetical protein
VLGREIRKLTNSVFALTPITGLSKGVSARDHYLGSHFDPSMVRQAHYSGLSVIGVVSPVRKLVRIAMSIHLGLVQFHRRLSSLFLMYLSCTTMR